MERQQGGSNTPRPLSGAQLQQWVESRFQREPSLGFEETERALRRFGRDFSAASLRRQFEISGRQRGAVREYIRGAIRTEMPDSAYQEHEGFQSERYRVIVEARVRNPVTGQIETKAISLVSNRSHSTQEWLEQAQNIFEREQENYGVLRSEISILQGYIKR